MSSVAWSDQTIAGELGFRTVAEQQSMDFMLILVSESRRSSLIGSVAFTSPVLIFYALLGNEMRPVPMYDDYHAILAS